MMRKWCSPSSSTLFVIGEVHDNTWLGIQGRLVMVVPEVPRNQKDGYTVKVDIWSVGRVFIEMLAGRPWEQDDFASVMFKVSNRDAEFGSLKPNYSL